MSAARQSHSAYTSAATASAREGRAGISHGLTGSAEMAATAPTAPPVDTPIKSGDASGLEEGLHGAPLVACQPTKPAAFLGYARPDDGLRRRHRAADGPSSLAKTMRAVCRSAPRRLWRWPAPAANKPAALCQHRRRPDVAQAGWAASTGRRPAGPALRLRAPGGAARPPAFRRRRDHRSNASGCRIRPRCRWLRQSDGSAHPYAARSTRGLCLR